MRCSRQRSILLESSAFVNVEQWTHAGATERFQHAFPNFNCCFVVGVRKAILGNHSAGI